MLGIKNNAGIYTGIIDTMNFYHKDCADQLSLKFSSLGLNFFEPKHMSFHRSFKYLWLETLLATFVAIAIMAMLIFGSDLAAVAFYDWGSLGVGFSIIAIFFLFVLVPAYHNLKHFYQLRKFLR